MAIANTNKSLNLSIAGSSGYTSAINTVKLSLQSNIENNNIDLFLKNNKSTSGELKEKTGWDISLISPRQTGPRSNGDIEYYLTDY